MRLDAWRDRPERLDFIEEEKFFGRLMVSWRDDRNMTRIAQPEQMAAAELGMAAGEVHLQEKRRRTPSVSAAATNSTTTNHHIARQPTQIAGQNYSQYRDPVRFTDHRQTRSRSKTERRSRLFSSADAIPIFAEITTH
jgi:hypothetical protein